MDAIECIKTRKSIRRFKPEPVPKELLLEVVEAAHRSPSYKNSQPWEVVIVSGEKKNELTKIMMDLLERDIEPKPDIEEPAGWPSEIEKRIMDNLVKRSKCYGIDLTSPDTLKRSKLANFRFYGAPHGIFFYQDGSLNEWSTMDMGMFVQNIMLAAHAKGFGTVPQGFLTDYSAEVKRFLGIPESKRLLLGMSIGYPDKDDKINSYTTERVDVTAMTQWVD